MAVGPRSNPQGIRTAARPPMSLLTVPGVLVGPGDPRDVTREVSVPGGGTRRVASWASGIGFLPDDCDVPLVWVAGTEDYPYWWQCADTGGESPADALESTNGAADGAKNISSPESAIEFDALQLWAGAFCRAGAPELAAEAAARATRKLEALTPTAIEHELWTGAVANLAGVPNPALIDAGLATLVQGGTPLGWVTALGELEQAIADSMPLTSPAIIHAQPRVVAAWAAARLVERVPAGTHLVTAAGTIVVPERGATGQSPASVNPAQTATYSYSWAYATGMVSVYLSEATPLDPQYSVNRDVNDLEVRAERDFIVAWNPCGLVAARVSLCDAYCSGGS